MIANPERTVVVSSLGWVDHDALLIFDVATSVAERRALGNGARYLSLHYSGSDYFSVGHHFDGAQVDLTIHPFSDPPRILASASINERGSKLLGDGLLWMKVPTIYIAYLAFEPWKESVLLRICAEAERVEVQPFDWFDDTYDKGYQGPMGALTLPGGEFALISVQRSSDLVLHELATGKKKRTVGLAGRGGNPSLQFRNGMREIWASDYDSLVVLDAEQLRVVRSARLQSSAPGTQKFIGEYSFVAGEQHCVVARPFSGDIVQIDVQTLEVTSSARTGGQPLEAVALPRGQVVARDWKSGDLLNGRLE
jgi:hypothetical protein